RCSFVFLAQTEIGPSSTGEEVQTIRGPLDGLRVVVEGLLPLAQLSVRMGPLVIGLGVLRIALDRLRQGADNLFPGRSFVVKGAGPVEVLPRAAVLPQLQVQETPFEVRPGVKLRRGRGLLSG